MERLQDASQGDNEQSMAKHEKTELPNHNEKKSKAHKYAQTLFKFHKFNPNLIRF
jgi:hypothetical protein